MAQTEITVQIFEDIKNVLAKLESMGFVWKDTFTGKDQYFTTLTPEQVKVATYKELLDSSIIIREFDKASTNTHQIMLVHKKKTIDAEGKVIGEEKTSLIVNDSAIAAKMLANAGLVNWMTLSQQNNFYVSGEKTVIAGTVEGLEGSFVEIEEYESIKDLSEEEKFGKLCEFVDSLGFEHGDDYSCKKIYMLYQTQK